MPSAAPAVERGSGTAASMVPRPFRVTSRRRETRDTFTIELEPADGGPPLVYRAGQFTMLYVFGAGEVPISISGPPDGLAPLRHTVRVVGSVTRAMAGLEPGDVLGVRGPFGSSWPLDSVADRDVLIVAGGIGLAPLMPVLHATLNDRSRHGRVTLLYGARTPRDILFARTLGRWRRRLDVDIRVSVDRPDRAWRGDVGVVTRLIARAPIDPATAVAMTCGPEIMMRFATHEFRRSGIDADRIWISMERSMKCGFGGCGHCQWGRWFVCRDGPVFRLDRVAELLAIREV